MPLDTLEMLTRGLAPKGQFDTEAMTITATVATATPVARRDARGMFNEILDPAGLDLAAIGDVPLLDSHKQSGVTSTLGRAHNFRIEDGVVVADLTFSTAPDVQPAVHRVKDGTLSAFSIGYAVATWRDGQSDGTRTKTATLWTIQEVSLVAIPADKNAKKRGADMALDDQNERSTQVENLRSLCGLTAEWATEQTAAETTIEEVRAAALIEMQKREADTPQIRIHGSNDDPAVIQQRQADAISFRMAGGELPDVSREYVNLSLKELAQDSLQRAGVPTRGLSADEIFTRAATHTTSDFPLLVSNAMGKVAMDAYKAAESPLKKLARQRTLPNFKESTQIRLGEMGRLEEMTESGEFKATSRGENGEKLQLSTFGRKFSVSRQLMIDDDLNMLGDITSAMGSAAAHTEADKLVETFTGNPNMADGNPVFDASRGNIGTAFAIRDTGELGTAVEAARIALFQTTGLDGETILGLRPDYLICGPQNELFLQAYFAEIFPTKVEDTNSEFSNMELLVEPRITGTDCWLMTDQRRMATLQYAYLQSAQGVQIQRKETWNTLGMEFRAFLDFGTGWSESRGAYYLPTN